MILAPIGPKGTNARDDVRTLQLLLNAAGATLTLDGAYGPGTAGALSRFRVSVGLADTGTVAPGDPVLAALKTKLPADVDPTKVYGGLVGATPQNIELFYPGLRAVFAKYQVSTPLRIAHFLAQIGHESGDLQWRSELASGQAYEGRADLGNTQPGDGPRFKGRGLIQLTGRANYAAYGKTIGVDLTADGNWTKVADDPALCADVAGWYWASRKINAAADADNAQKVTKLINGGLNGLDDRLRRLARAKDFWF
jgi:putative chitinase